MALRTLAPLAVPGLVLLGMLAAYRSGTDVFEALTAGARKGLETTLAVAPALLALLALHEVEDKPLAQRFLRQELQLLRHEEILA